DAGEWVVDLRSRVAFAAGHVRGTLQFELGDNMATYLGWLIPWGMPLTLLGETQADVASAQRHLVRIGIDQVQSAATGTPGQWAGGQSLSCYPVTDFAGYARSRHQVRHILLDVRRDSEWASAQIEGALHVPLHALPRRIKDLPDGRIWVHCQAGYRASVAAALLDAAGRNVVLINDDFAVAQRIGLASAGAVPAY
ncbi:MAG TPA: rhodanese-like domain-containing protein, partial [Nakamurella sp.]